MTCLRLLILLSLFYLSYAAKRRYVFCENQNGTIIVELDAVISVEDTTGSHELKNIEEGNATDCSSKDRREFRIGFENNTMLKFIIEEKNGTVSLTELEVVGSVMGSTGTISQELSKSNEYYVCNHAQTFSLQPADIAIVSVVFNEVKLQGFEVVNNSFSQNFAVCAAPPNSTTTLSPTVTTTPNPANLSTSVSPTNASTSTAASNATTTTHLPTTTSHLTTTTKLITTTTAKPTTPSATPTIAKLDLTVNGTICLMVEFHGTLTFNYNKSGVITQYEHTIDHKDVTKVSGSCVGDTPHVTGILTEGCRVEFQFSKMGKKTPARRLLAASFEYELSKVTVTYDTRKPPQAKGGQVETRSANVTSVKTSSGKIYQCKSLQVLLNDGKTKFTVNNFKAGAFNPNTKNVDTCDADKSDGNSNVVPIVVGVILACLVVIIIVAYLIGRRRNREGYQSV